MLLLLPLPALHGQTMAMSMSMSMNMISSKLIQLQSLPPLSLPNAFQSQLSSKPSITFATSPRLSRSSSVIAARASSSSSSNFSENIADALADVTIFTTAGLPVMFKDLWDQNDGMAVVALLRHFGCPCCWELGSALKESKPKFDSAGVKLIAIGVGEPNKARIFADRDASPCLVFLPTQGALHICKPELPFPMDCLYADPNRKAYDALGLYYGLGRTFFNPASAKVFSRFDTLLEAVKNYTAEATPDDRSGVLQQGGMFVFKGKQLLYARKDEGTGDHAPLDNVFEICCKVPDA